MIGTKTETDIEISEPIVVDERRIFTVSEKRSITIPKVGGVAAVRVSPLYVLVLEGNSCYGYSVNKTELLDLEVLFRNEPAIREEFLNVSRMSSDSLNITRNENRVPDLYSALPSIIIKGIKSMSTFESEKDQNQHEHHREMEDVRKQIMTVGNRASRIPRGHTCRSRELQVQRGETRRRDRGRSTAKSIRSSEIRPFCASYSEVRQNR